MRPNAVVLLSCFVLAAGSSASCKRTDRAPPPAAPAESSPGTATPSSPGGQPPRPQPIEYQQRIVAAEQIVRQDPKNVGVWIQLGNDYFDTQQRQRAIDAYARALELQPNNPDVITDQGVMYRELGAHDKAIANFKKANELDPKHIQSLYNLGVVYAHDLKDADKAAQAWRRVIDVAPGSPQAAQALQGLAELQQRSVQQR